MVGKKEEPNSLGRMVIMSAVRAGKLSQNHTTVAVNSGVKSGGIDLNRSSIVVGV